MLSGAWCMGMGVVQIKRLAPDWPSLPLILWTGTLCGVSAPPSHHSAGGRAPWACHSMGGSPGNEAAWWLSQEEAGCCFHRAFTAACTGRYQMGRRSKQNFFCLLLVLLWWLTSSWIAVVLPLRSLADTPVTQTVTFLYNFTLWCVLILWPMECMWARVSCVCYWQGSFIKLIWWHSNSSNKICSP